MTDIQITLAIIGYIIAALITFRSTLWEKNPDGNYEMNGGFALFMGAIWPIVAASFAIYCICIGIKKVFEVPAYYAFVPKDVRKGRAKIIKPQSADTW